MAKKKRKKTRRPTPRSASGTSTATSPEVEASDGAERPTATGDRRRAPQAGASVSNRQARKEAARRERERRIKAARRRERIRRAVRWGLVVLVIAGIAGFVWLRSSATRRLQETATAAAAAFDCSDPEPPLPDAGRGHTPPFAEGENGIPAASGAHNPNPLPAEPHVYEQPVPEPNAVHNLEHGYVLIYYRSGGDGPLPDDVRAELEGLAESEGEVIMAPYPGLAEDTNLALVAWRRVQSCDVPTDADPSDAQAVASYFIERFRNELAPEAATP